MYGQNFTNLESLQEQIPGLSPGDFANLLNQLFNFDVSRMEENEQMWMPMPDFPLMDPNQLQSFGPAFFPHLDLPAFVQSETTDPPLRPIMSNKKIGPLTMEERMWKIQRFREKRNRRSFGRKVAYACRKQVADSRLRVRGRFITKSEAEKLKEETNNN